MIYLVFYGTPILSILFFVNCISVAKKIKKGEDTQIQTVFGSILIAIIVFGLITASIN